MRCAIKYLVSAMLSRSPSEMARKRHPPSLATLFLAEGKARCASPSTPAPARGLAFFRSETAVVGLRTGGSVIRFGLGSLGHENPTRPKGMAMKIASALLARLALAAFLMLPSAARAQGAGSTAQPVVPGYQTVGPTGLVFTPYGPMGPGETPTPIIPGYTTPVAGAQYGLAVTSSTALTVPATAKAALVTIEGTSVRFADDGTTPTPSVGQGPFVAGVPPLVFYGADMTAVRFIQVTATATINVTYYKQ